MTGVSSLVRGRFLSPRRAFRWIVAAGWSLLLCDCWLSSVRGQFLGPKKACGEPLEVSGMATGWPEQVPGLVMMAMGGAGQPTSDLSLRFLSPRRAFRWLVAAGWSLLLCDCWLVTCSGTVLGPQEGLWRALGGLWDGHGMARAGARIGHDGHWRCWAAHE